MFCEFFKEREDRNCFSKSIIIQLSRTPTNASKTPPAVYHQRNESVGYLLVTFITNKLFKIIISILSSSSSLFLIPFLPCTSTHTHKEFIQDFRRGTPVAENGLSFQSFLKERSLIFHSYAMYN